MMDMGRPSRETWKAELQAKHNKKLPLSVSQTDVVLRPPESSLLDSSPIVTPRANTELPIDLGRYHALVIGNDAYAHLTPLKNAVNDAEAVANLLRTDYEFEVTVLINASRDEMITAMDRARANLTAMDNFLIYYAGHGVFDAASGRGYWLPIDARDDSRARWIEDTTVTDTLKAMKALHVMIVADSCYSGTLVRDIGVKLGTEGDRHAYLRRVAEKRSRTVLTSGGLEPVSDGQGGNHSVFGQALLNALVENSGVIEGQQLFGKLRRSVMLNADQTPQYSDLRNAGHDGGEFLFVRR
jgi:hypothetical protein